MTKTNFQAIVLATLALVAAAPALADPVKDNRKADIKEYCDGGTFTSEKECWNEFKGNIAYDTGLKEAVVIKNACPELVVTDEDLRALRNQKYGATQKYKQGFDRAMDSINRNSDAGMKMLCATAKVGGTGYPKTYQAKWLEDQNEE